MTTPQRTFTVVASLIALAVVVEGVLLFLLVAKVSPGEQAAAREEATRPSAGYRPPVAQSATPPRARPSPGTVVVAGLVVTPFSFLIFLLCLVLYFLPTLIAFWRGHQSWMAIGLVNFAFGGCLGLGWFLALIWALAGVWSREHYHYHQHHYPGQ
jgi:hypothetical protein